MLARIATFAALLAERRLSPAKRSLLKADLDRHLDTHVLALALRDEAFRGVFYFRCAGLGLVGRTLIRFAKFFLPGPAGLSLSDPIGPGLLLQHGTCSIISPTSIGRNCTIYQQVTIGHAPGSAKRGGGGPIIDDDVTVFAGAILVGKIQVGRGAVIGAGAVVTGDVPAGSTMVGVPARPLKKRSQDLSSDAP